MMHNEHSGVLLGQRHRDDREQERKKPRVGSTQQWLQSQCDPWAEFGTWVSVSMVSGSVMFWVKGTLRKKLRKRLGLLGTITQFKIRRCNQSSFHSRQGLGWGRQRERGVCWRSGVGTGPLTSFLFTFILLILPFQLQFSSNIILYWFQVYNTVARKSYTLQGDPPDVFSI